MNFSGQVALPIWRINWKRGWWARHDPSGCSTIHLTPFDQHTRMHRASLAQKRLAKPYELVSLVALVVIEDISAMGVERPQKHWNTSNFKTTDIATSCFANIFECQVTSWWSYCSKSQRQQCLHHSDTKALEALAFIEQGDFDWTLKKH